MLIRYVKLKIGGAWHMRESMKILIAFEQKKEVMSTILSCMKQFEYIVCETTDRYEQITEMVKETKPDLIISDISLNGGDGFSLLQLCKQEEELKETKFVF